MNESPSIPLEGRVNYIAYGSNLNVDQMERRCPGAFVACTGILEGYQLSFRKSKTSCYLSLDPCNKSRVDVAVWSISPEDEKSLDYYEGFPDYYQKFNAGVNANDGSTVEGIVYVLPQDRTMGPCSQEYLDRVASGYKHFGFDAEPLMKAYQRAYNRQNA